MDWGSRGGGGWVVMTVVMLAFWALVVGGIVALFRNGQPAVSKGVLDSGATPGPSAEDVLDGRFARGEINEQEYHARRAVLYHPTLLKDADGR
ncbi:MAG: SHOCT domain-containing protein [Actinomycetota bacterium]|nr:SHOCT domain-containing protein [Actinomycetota bacterium]